jgi:hypothetical protein
MAVTARLVVHVGLIVMVMVTAAMVMMMMMVMVVHRNDRGACRSQHRAGAHDRMQRRNKGPPLAPQQPRPDDDDQRVADDLDPAHGLAHRLCGRIQQHGRNADDCDCRHGLQQRRGEGEDDTAPPRLIVRHEI